MTQLKQHEPMLVPVPRGMCGAFYQFMGAGAPRGDDGQIMMLSPRLDCEPNTTDPACPDCGAVDCDRAASGRHQCSSGFAPGLRKVCERCGRMDCPTLSKDSEPC